MIGGADRRTPVRVSEDLDLWYCEPKGAEKCTGEDVDHRAFVKIL
jgi:hypothetical protein